MCQMDLKTGLVSLKKVISVKQEKIKNVQNMLKIHFVEYFSKIGAYLLKKIFFEGIFTERIIKENHDDVPEAKLDKLFFSYFLR